jgi:predicted CXXCH cytochrome family protein
LDRRHKCGDPILVLFLLLAMSVRASAAEHPGILDRQDNCSTCHADKFKGKSVHSAMSIPCTVCHVAQTQGDMTTMDLLMPKEQICFACHVKSSETQEHSPPVKGVCVNCHDSHNSNRRLLLKEQADSRHRSSVPLPTPSKTTAR